MTSSKIDLHVHSTYSDGTFTPRELIQEAVRQGVSAMALTDHDNFDGVMEAALAASQAKIEFVPGVEMSTNYHGKEIHIVGLFIDIHNKALTTALAGYRDCRDHRNERIVEKLQTHGFDITMDALTLDNPDCVITRANIARFLVNHNQLSSMNLAFEKYIGDDGPCYVDRVKSTPEEAIHLIKNAGGIAILAHPMLYHMSTVSLQNLITDLKSAGLDALEAIYSTYSPGEEALMKRTAAQNGLLISGGSDFHGENKPYIHLGTGRGKLYIPYSVLTDLKTRLSSR